MKAIYTKEYLDKVSTDLKGLQTIFNELIKFIPSYFYEKDFEWETTNKESDHTIIKNYINDILKLMENNCLENSYIKISANYQTLKNRYQLKDATFEDVLNRIDLILKYYQKIKDASLQELTDAFYFLHFLNSTHITLSTYLDTILEIGRMLEDKPEINQSQASLEIYLIDAELNVSEFGTTLSLLGRSYNSLKKLLDTKVEDLEVIRIASGSLLTKSYGDAKLISTLKTIFTKIIEYIPKLNAKTQTDRVTELLELIEKSADITQKLESMDINTATSKDALKKALSHVTANLYAITKKCDKIKLDDEFYDVREGIKLTEEEYQSSITSENN